MNRKTAKYCVVSYFYDNGKTEAIIQSDFSRNLPLSENHKDYDLYRDYCNTIEEARKIKTDVLNA